MPNRKNIGIVADLSTKFENAKAIYFTDYQGLDVSAITELRRQFTSAEVEYEVAKNTLIKIAAENNELSGVQEVLSGPTAIAISYDEPVKPAKVLRSFIKIHKKPIVKGILFEGEMLEDSAFEQIAELPPREVLLGQFVGLLQSSLIQLIRTIGSPMSNLVGALNSLKEQKS